MNGVDEIQKVKDHGRQFFDKRPRYT